MMIDGFAFLQSVCRDKTFSNRRFNVNNAHESVDVI